MASGVVLDSSVILAVLFSEPGSDRVVPLLKGALVSAVNLAEAHTLLVRRGVGAEVAWRQLGELGCEVCQLDEEQARLAGELAGEPGARELSLGDRACLALAMAHGATAYTTNAAWRKAGAAVEVIR